MKYLIRHSLAALIAGVAACGVVAAQAQSGTAGQMSSQPAAQSQGQATEHVPGQADSHVMPPAGTLPPIYTVGPVSYLSGGVGLDQSKAIEAASHNWPLTLEFSERAGSQAEYIADVKVTINDAKGHMVLDTTAQGPFLLARLAPGTYTVEASFQGHNMRRKVEVKKDSPTRLSLEWPTMQAMQTTHETSKAPSKS